MFRKNRNLNNLVNLDDIELPKNGTKRDYRLSLDDTKRIIQGLREYSKTTLKDHELDFILCVGSVINYTDALCTIQEFSRILNSGGYLILEFENSYSFEYFLTNSFKKKANIVNTF